MEIFPEGRAWHNRMPDGEMLWRFRQWALAKHTTEKQRSQLSELPQISTPAPQLTCLVIHNPRKHPPPQIKDSMYSWSAPHSSVHGSSSHKSSGLLVSSSWHRCLPSKKSIHDKLTRSLATPTEHLAYSCAECRVLPDCAQNHISAQKGGGTHSESLPLAMWAGGGPGTETTLQEAVQNWWQCHRLRW